MRFFVLIILTCFTFELQAQQKTLSATEMQSDINILHDAWISLHPGLYRYNTPGEIEASFKRLHSQCSVPMPETKFYILLSQMAQQIKCGHTYLNPLNLDEETAGRILPHKVISVFFEITGDHKMIITQTLALNAPYKRGDEIVAINRVPVKRITDSLLTVSRSDGNHAIGKKYKNMNETPDEANGYSLFDIYFPLFFQQAGRWTMDVKPYKGKSINRYTVELIPLKDRLTAYRNRYGKVPSGEKSWDYKLLGTHAAYMKFGTFAFWNSKFNEKRFVDSAFQDLKKHPEINNLVIDIRGNEGGDNTGDYILSHITSQKLGCENPEHACYRFLTVPDSLLPYLSTWDKTFKAPKNPDDFFINKLGFYEQKRKSDDYAFIEPMEPHFGGKVFLLCDAKNSSAGYEMARNFKTAKLGKLIGETTGGSQQGINGGKFFFLTLPNSKFEVDLPLIFNYHPGKPDSGILPDYQIRTTQQSIAQKEDPQLMFIFRLIKIEN